MTAAVGEVENLRAEILEFEHITIRDERPGVAILRIAYMRITSQFSIAIRRASPVSSIEWLVSLIIVRTRGSKVESMLVIQKAAQILHWKESGCP